MLHRANFSDYPLLEHLYISECGVERIEIETFVDLTNLKWLDLSNNRIRLLQDYSFRGLHLQHLFLNGNRNLQLKDNSFSGLETTGLYLHDCSMQKLVRDVLSPLNMTLRYLWLNGNELERLDKKLLPVFHSLSHLRLGSNPLHCNCEVVWFKEFYDKNGDMFKGAPPPSCLTPQRLKGKYFNTLSLFDFRCQAPVFNNIDALLDNSQGRLKCTASGDPAPTIFWIQPTGDSRRYSAPTDEDARTNEGVLLISGGGDDSMEDEISGMYICLALNEAGNVTLTLNVSMPRSSKSPRHHNRHHLSQVTPTPLATTPGAAGKPGPNDGQVTTPGPSAPEPGLSASDKPTKSSKPIKTSRSNNAVSKSDSGRGYNFTALNMLDFKRRAGERLFNLTELVGAVIGTHVCTLLLCLIFMPIYLKRQWKRRTPHHGLEKSPNEALYLNGIGRLDYMDTPSPTKR